MYLKTHLLELSRNQVRSPRFFVSGFRVLVKLMSPAHHVWLQCRKLFNQIHCVVPTVAAGGLYLFSPWAGGVEVTLAQPVVQDKKRQNK